MLIIRNYRRMNADQMQLPELKRLASSAGSGKWRASQYGYAVSHIGVVKVAVGNCGSVTFRAAA